MGYMAEILFRDEVHQVIGCCIEVLNEVGHGFHEKIYERALVVEFNLRGIPCEQQKEFNIVYKATTIGVYVPDLICYQHIVLDTKTIEMITDDERGKMINYLKVTGLQLGLIVNFKHRKLEWERIVLTR
jgi:GxxExxY protein